MYYFHSPLYSSNSPEQDYIFIPYQKKRETNLMLKFKKTYLRMDAAQQKARYAYGLPQLHESVI